MMNLTIRTRFSIHALATLICLILSAVTLNAQTDADNTGVINVTTNADDQARTLDMWNWRLPNDMLTAGQEVSLSITSADMLTLSSAQLTVAYDQTSIQFVTLNPGVMNITPAEFFDNPATGLISVIYTPLNFEPVEVDEVLFTLVFNVTQSSETKDVLDVTSDLLTANAWDGDGTKYDIVLTVGAGASSTQNVDLNQSGLQLMQNSPNPFSDETVIGFNLSEKSDVSLKLFAVDGRLLNESTVESRVGYNEIKMNASDLKAYNSAVIYYQLQAGELQATKRMIVLD